MKVFLFMYPVAEFFDEVPEMLSYSFAPERGRLGKSDLYGINKVIEARYRAGGYEIAWVFYGKQGKKHLPETSDLAKYVTVEPGDLQISSGSYTGKPDFDFIFGQLPEEIDELVVGGFHWLSCVAFTAEYAIEALGIPTRIDEDTTQSYFAKTSLIRTQQERDIELPGEVCHPWQIAGTSWDQEYYCEGMILRPWIVLNPPSTEFTFCLDGQLETFQREELVAHFEAKDARRSK